MWTPTGNVRRGTFHRDRDGMVDVHDRDGVCLEDVPEDRRGYVGVGVHDVLGYVMDRKEDTDVEEREDEDDGGNVLEGEASRFVLH